MITLLGVLVAMWFCRRVLWWIVMRAIVFALGFRVGWMLVNRPSSLEPSTNPWQK